MLFLIQPRPEAKMYRLSKQGKEEIPEVALPEPVPFKYGPHMVNFVAIFDNEPQELNLGYYDGGAATYDAMRNMLTTGDRQGPYDESLRYVTKLLGFNVDATLILKCDQGGIYRFTYRPVPQMFDVYKFEIGYLIDETRTVAHCELKDALERKQLRQMEFLNALFDPNNKQVGTDTFADYLHPLK